MADREISFKLDLDSKEFVTGVLHAKDIVSNLGEAKNLEGLVEGLTKVAPLLGAIGVAAFALKTTFEAVFEAEKIHQINKQFETLTKNSGILGAELKEALKTAAMGLVDDTDLTIAANKALVEMGSSAAKLPELFELARKAATVMGGEAIQRFEELNHAIATGNQRGLKQLGITVDLDKAYRKYADSIGVAVSALSDSEKRQAVLNETLEKGRKQLAGVDVDLNTATSSWKLFKVALKEAAETAAIAWDAIAGPKVRDALNFIKDWAHSAKTFLSAGWGKGAEQASAQAEQLKDKIQDLKVEIIDAEQIMLRSSDVTQKMFLSSQIENSKKKLKEYEEQLYTTEQVLKGYHAEESKAVAPTSGGGSTEADYTKRQAQESKYQADILKLKQQYADESMKLATTNETIEAALNEKTVLMHAEMINKKKAIDASDSYNNQQKIALKKQLDEESTFREIQLAEEANAKKQNLAQQRIAMATNEDALDAARLEQKKLIESQYELQKSVIQANHLLSEQAKNQAILVAEQQKNDQILRMDQDLYAQREQMIRNWVAQSNSASESFAKGFAGASMSAMNNLKNFSAQGSAVFGMMTNRMGNMFMELGEGSKSASDVMRGAMLGMIADVAQYYGMMMLAAGIFPPNPPALAGGAALLILAGMLRGMAKGKSQSFGGMGSMGGGGDIGGGVGALSAAPQQVQAQEQQKKMTQLVVNGSIYETEQTKMRLLDLIREASDATDFKYQKIGGGI